MSDNLRDRIAAVIDGVWQSGYPDAPADALADAVIEALGLREVNLGRGIRQYVTDVWKADDE
jgi:hypothetical protein